MFLYRILFIIFGIQKKSGTARVSVWIIIGVVSLVDVEFGKCEFCLSITN